MGWLSIDAFFEDLEAHNVATWARLSPPRSPARQREAPRQLTDDERRGIIRALQDGPMYRGKVQEISIQYDVPSWTVFSLLKEIRDARGIVL